MAAPADSNQWLTALRSPDSSIREQAARQIIEQYFQRLCSIAWKNLHPRIRQRVDPEEVVNSGVGSLMIHIQQGEVSFDSQGNLADHLLVQAVLNKARQAARRHTAQKRDVFRERPVPESLDSDDPLWKYCADESPSPEDALFLQEAIELLPDDLQEVALLKLQGKTDEEVARALDYACTETIRLKKRLIEKLWKDYFTRS